MPICEECGKEFDLGHARRVIGHRFGGGAYDNECPEGELCEDCVSDILGSAMGAWNQLRDLMGSGWDDD